MRSNRPASGALRPVQPRSPVAVLSRGTDLLVREIQDPVRKIRVRAEPVNRAAPTFPYSSSGTCRSCERCPGDRSSSSSRSLNPFTLAAISDANPLTRVRPIVLPSASLNASSSSSLSNIQSNSAGRSSGSSAIRVARVSYVPSVDLLECDLEVQRDTRRPFRLQDIDIANGHAFAVSIHKAIDDRIGVASTQPGERQAWNELSRLRRPSSVGPDRVDRMTRAFRGRASGSHGGTAP